MQQIKQCSKCEITKSTNDFHFMNKNTDTFQSRCKACRNKPKRHNKVCPNCDNLKSLDKFNMRKYKNGKIGYRFLCCDCENKYKNNWQILHRNELNTKAKEKRKNDPDRFKATKDKYRKNNINNKLRENLRKRIRTAIKNNQKSGSAVKDLGCSVDYLKQYLEGQFYSHSKTNEKMTWDNYGYFGWHIDHIIPLANFDLTDREQFLKACHYTNLQPLWAKENLSKGGKI